jgi:hypothetical protein
MTGAAGAASLATAERSACASVSSRRQGLRVHQHGLQVELHGAAIRTANLLPDIYLAGAALAQLAEEPFPVSISNLLPL